MSLSNFTSLLPSESGRQLGATIPDFNKATSGTRELIIFTVNGTWCDKLLIVEGSDHPESLLKLVEEVCDRSAKLG